MYDRHDSFVDDGPIELAQHRIAGISDVRKRVEEGAIEVERNAANDTGGGETQKEVAHPFTPPSGIPASCARIFAIVAG